MLKDIMLFLKANRRHGYCCWTRLCLRLMNSQKKEKHQAVTDSEPRLTKSTTGRATLSKSLILLTQARKLDKSFAFVIDGLHLAFHECYI